MKTKMTLLSASKVNLSILKEEIEKSASEIPGLFAGFDFASSLEESTDPVWVWADLTVGAKLDTIKKKLEKFPNTYVVGILREDSVIPFEQYGERIHFVHDYATFPFRSMDLWSKLQAWAKHQSGDQISVLLPKMDRLIVDLEEDLALAERLQKSRLPNRFPDTRGLRFASRYIAGQKAGGDYFDIAESKNGFQTSFIMTHASSYGLSSAVVAVLARVAMRISAEESKSAVETVRLIYREVLQALKPTDQLSVTYACLNQKTLQLSYVNLGANTIAVGSGDRYKKLSQTPKPLSRDSGIAWVEQKEHALSPGDRVLLLSGGFEFEEKLALHLKADAKDTLNELAFHVKKNLKDSDLPERDASALIVDLDVRSLRVAN